jgi:GT2 family glycosyltransferase
MRAKQRGWTIVQVPSVTAVHHEGRSSASAKAASLAHLYASRRRLHRKHRGPLFRAAASFITTFGLAHERARLIRLARGTATTDAATVERIAGIDRILHRDP